MKPTPNMLAHQPTTMRAMLTTAYGPPGVIQQSELPLPLPKAHEVLIKVHAATVTAGDCELRNFQVAGWVWLPLRIAMGIRKPRQPILGQEFAGEIVGIGKEVKRYAVGDRVFASTGFGFGTYADYRCHSTRQTLAHIPKGITYAAAATLPTGGINALHFLRKGEVKPNDKVLLNGAGGSIGTYALQLAKIKGAEVSCVDHGSKLDMLKSLGADHVIDYTQTDFTQQDKKYDVIIDIVGKIPYRKGINALTKDGRFVMGNPRLGPVLRGFGTALFSDKKVLFELAGENDKDYDYLLELLQSKKIEAVIDTKYPLEQLAAAHAYVEAGHKKGNVIIDLSNNAFGL